MKPRRWDKCDCFLIQSYNEKWTIWKEKWGSKRGYWSIEYGSLAVVAHYFAGFPLHFVVRVTTGRLSRVEGEILHVPELTTILAQISSTIATEKSPFKNNWNCENNVSTRFLYQFPLRRIQSSKRTAISNKWIQAGLVHFFLPLSEPSLKWFEKLIYAQLIGYN